MTLCIKPDNLHFKSNAAIKALSRSILWSTRPFILFCKLFCAIIHEFNNTLIESAPKSLLQQMYLRLKNYKVWFGHTLFNICSAVPKWSEFWILFSIEFWVTLESCLVLCPDSTCPYFRKFAKSRDYQLLIIIKQAFYFRSVHFDCNCNKRVV